MFKEQKGITLIALVITIIVLLILAGVTIAMLGGNNGTPAKANEAAAKDAVAAAKDQLNLLAMDTLTTFYDTTYVQETSTTQKNLKAGNAVAKAFSEIATDSTTKKATTGYEGVTFEEKPSAQSGGAYSRTLKIQSTKDTSVKATATIDDNGNNNICHNIHNRCIIWKLFYISNIQNSKTSRYSSYSFILS